MTDKEFLERYDRGSNFTQCELKDLSDWTIFRQFVDKKTGHDIIYRYFIREKLEHPRFFMCESTSETHYQPVEVEPPDLVRAWRTGKSPWRKKRSQGDV